MSIILTLLVMVFLTGCFVTPDDPIPDPESPIICEGGSYSTYFSEWAFVG